MSSNQGVRDRVRQAIASSGEKWALCAEHDDAESALQHVDLLRPDVVVLDNAVRVSAASTVPFDVFVGHGAHRSHVLLLGDAKSEPLVTEALKAGVKGFVAASDGDDLIGLALDAVTRGKPFFSSEATELLLSRFLANRGAAGATTKRAATGSLTPRERDVVRLLGEGLPTRDVAAALHISVKTAENHRANAMNKLGARSVPELVRRAVQDGFIA